MGTNKKSAAQAQAGMVSKNQISESIFGWGLRNDDGHNLSMDDTDEIAEYIMKQAAQAQAQAKPIAAVRGYYNGMCVVDTVGDVNVLPAGMALYSQPQAQAQAGDGEVNLLAKNQDCGCVICTCENEERCMGCGAKHCGTHPVGQIPRPKYTRQQPAQVNQQLLEESWFKQGAEGFRKELLAATTPFLRPHIEGVFAVFAHAHGFEPESNVGDQVRAEKAAIAAAQEQA